MRKDDSNIKEWCKHTRNSCGGRRRVNKANRRNVKMMIKREFGSVVERPMASVCKTEEL